MATILTILFVPMLPHGPNLMAIGFYLTLAALCALAYSERKEAQ